MASSDPYPRPCPTRGKRLVEFFGSIDALFNASLTELEAAGLPAPAGQSLGMGAHWNLRMTRLPALKRQDSDLAARGLVIFSGLARGVDTAFAALQNLSIRKRIISGIPFRVAEPLD